MTYSQITINTDGGARGNPGPAAIGVSAKSQEQILFEISDYIGNQTNNVAEYTAVIKALEYLKAHAITCQNISFVLDSELIVRQIEGQYRVKEPHLKTLNDQVKLLINNLRQENISQHLTFITVPRTQNKRADQLVNQALDSRK